MRALKTMVAALLPAPLVMHLRAIDHYLNGEAELRLLKRLVDPRRKAIDAGANIGTYCYFLRRHATAVHAHEPNPELAGRLRALMPDIHVRQVALSDNPAELTFSVPISADGRPTHELGSVAQTFDGEVRTFPVQCVTLDSEQFDDVGFIKVDVEQHEREVLRGGHATIVRCRPVILVEVYPLKYPRPLPEEFAFILKEDYCGWFSYGGQWLPMSAFRSGTHADPARFGDPKAFMGNNVVFVPIDHPRSKTGP